MSRMMLLVALLIVPAGSSRPAPDPSPPSAPVTPAPATPAPERNDKGGPGEGSRAAEDTAVAFVEKLGGKATRDDKLPGRPVIRVDLSSTKVTDAGLKELAPLTNLTTLSLFATKVTDAGLAHIRDCKGLSVLILDGTGVTDASLGTLEGFASLTSLDVRKSKFTAEGVKKLAAALPRCKIEHDGGTVEPNLESDRRAAEYVLSIGGAVRVNGGDEIKTAAGLPKGRSTLTDVKLYENKVVTDAGLAHFKDCKGLVNVNLDGTKVTDAGLAHLKGCTGLTNLGLGGTGVTDAGLAHLRDCKNLKELDVKGTKVTAKGLDTLHAAMPTCKIEHDGGTVEPKK